MNTFSQKLKGEHPICGALQPYIVACIVCRGNCVRFVFGDYTVNTEAVKVCSCLLQISYLCEVGYSSYNPH